MTDLKEISTNCWEIPKTGGMRVPGRIYATRDALQRVQTEKSLTQVKNVAHLPGIVKYSLAMPDIHWGYGFPIGGVAATDYQNGVISPGGVGYDINCGVRLIKTNLFYPDIQKSIKNLVASVFSNVPTGVGSYGAIRKLSKQELRKVLRTGASWAVEQGYGRSEDLEKIEENGCFEEADPDLLSDRAYQRGTPQLGTLGSGNHFIEIGRVAQIFDGTANQVFDLDPDQIVVLIHTGSRGLGYQVCDDFIKVTLQATQKYNIEVPDRQLVCAPIQSPEGQDYLSAMQAAANFAFANRQIIQHLVEESFLQSLALSPGTLGMQLIWDIAHNIA